MALSQKELDELLARSVVSESPASPYESYMAQFAPTPEQLAELEQKRQGDGSAIETLLTGIKEIPVQALGGAANAMNDFFIGVPAAAYDYVAGNNGDELSFPAKLNQEINERINNWTGAPATTAGELGRGLGSGLGFLANGIITSLATGGLGVPAALAKAAPVLSKIPGAAAAASKAAPMLAKAAPWVLGGASEGLVEGGNTYFENMAANDNNRSEAGRRALANAAINVPIGSASDLFGYVAGAKLLGKPLASALMKGGMEKLAAEKLASTISHIAASGATEFGQETQQGLSSQYFGPGDRSLLEVLSPENIKAVAGNEGVMGGLVGALMGAGVGKLNSHQSNKALSALEANANIDAQLSKLRARPDAAVNQNIMDSIGQLERQKANIDAIKQMGFADERTQAIDAAYQNNDAVKKMLDALAPYEAPKPEAAAPDVSETKAGPAASFSKEDALTKLNGVQAEIKNVNAMLAERSDPKEVELLNAYLKQLQMVRTDYEVASRSRGDKMRSQKVESGNARMQNINDAFAPAVKLLSPISSPETHVSPEAEAAVVTERTGRGAELEGLISKRQAELDLEMKKGKKMSTRKVGTLYAELERLKRELGTIEEAPVQTTPSVAVRAPEIPAAEPVSPVQSPAVSEAAEQTLPSAAISEQEEAVSQAATPSEAPDDRQAAPVLTRANPYSEVDIANKSEWLPALNANKNVLEANLATKIKAFAEILKDGTKTRKNVATVSMLQKMASKLPDSGNIGTDNLSAFLSDAKNVNGLTNSRKNELSRLAYDIVDTARSPEIQKAMSNVQNLRAAMRSDTSYGRTYSDSDEAVFKTQKAIQQEVRAKEDELAQARAERAAEDKSVSEAATIYLDGRDETQKSNIVRTGTKALREAYERLDKKGAITGLSDKEVELKLTIASAQRKAKARDYSGAAKILEGYRDADGNGIDFNHVDSIGRGYGLATPEMVRMAKMQEQEMIRKLEGEDRNAMRQLYGDEIANLKSPAERAERIQEILQELVAADPSVLNAEVREQPVASRVVEHSEKPVVYPKQSEAVEPLGRKAGEQSVAEAQRADRAREIVADYAKEREGKAEERAARVPLRDTDVALTPENYSAYEDAVLARVEAAKNLLQKRENVVESESPNVGPTIKALDTILAAARNGTPEDVIRAIRDADINLGYVATDSYGDVGQVIANEQRRSNAKDNHRNVYGIGLERAGDVSVEQRERRKADARSAKISEGVAYKASGGRNEAESVSFKKIPLTDRAMSQLESTEAAPAGTYARMREELNAQAKRDAAFNEKAKAAPDYSIKKRVDQSLPRYDANDFLSPEKRGEIIELIEEHGRRAKKESNKTDSATKKPLLREYAKRADGYIEALKSGDRDKIMIAATGIENSKFNFGLTTTEKTRNGLTVDDILNGKTKASVESAGGVPFDVNAESLRAAFGKRCVVSQGKDGSWAVRTPQNKTIRITESGNVVVPSVVIESTWGRDVADRVRSGEAVVAGSFSVSPDGIPLIELAKADASNFTMNHELFHAVVETSMAREQWNTLRREFADSGMTDARAEEIIANRFAEWREGRLKPSNIVQAIFRKVSDFFKGIRSMFTGENYEDVFRSIESGKIWEQDGETATGQNRPHIIGTVGAMELDRAEGTDNRRKNLSIAEQMEREGKPAQEIWWATGWERDLDDSLWKMEILDSPEMASGLSDMRVGDVRRLGDVFNNPELYKAYPDMADIEVVAVDDSPNRVANYNPQTDAIAFNVNHRTRTSLPVALVHEIQHAVQAREGFDPGTSDKYTEAIMRSRLGKEKSPDEIRQSALEMYNNKKGEVEARNAMYRTKLDPQTRGDISPGATADRSHDQIWFDDAEDRYNGASDYREENDTSRSEAGAYGRRTMAADGMREETSKRDAESGPRLGLGDTVGHGAERRALHGAEKSNPYYSEGADAGRTRDLGTDGVSTSRVGSDVGPELQAHETDGGVARGYGENQTENSRGAPGNNRGRDDSANEEHLHLDRGHSPRREVERVELDADERYKPIDELFGKENRQKIASRAMREVFDDKWMLRHLFGKDVHHTYELNDSTASGRARYVIENGDAEAGVKGLPEIVNGIKDTERKDFESFVDWHNLKDIAAAREDIRAQEDSLREMARDELRNARIIKRDLRGARNGFFSSDEIRMYEDAADGSIKQCKEYLKEADALKKLRASKHTNASSVDYDAKIAEMAAEHPDWRERAEDVFKMGRYQLQRLVDIGVVSPELQEKLLATHPHYAPLVRNIGGENLTMDAYANMINNGILSVTNPIKRYSGDNNYSLASPLEQLAENQYRIEQLATRQKVLEQISDGIDKGEYDGIIRRAGAKDDPKVTEGELNFFKNGTKERLIADKDVIALLSSFKPTSAGESAALKLAQIPGRVLRSGVTLSPSFAIPNMIRDSFMSAVINPEVRPIVDTVRGLISVIKKDANFDDFLKHGGSQELTWGSRDSRKTEMSSLYKNTQPLTGKAAGKKLIEWLGSLSEASEAATRVGTYMRLVEKGMSKEEAAFKTIDQMWFSRGGRSSKAINKIVPFSNAALQGTYSLGKALFHDGKIDRGVLLRGMMYVAMPSIIASMWNYGDDDRRKLYEEIPQQQKNTHWNIVLDKDTIIRIPKPHAAGMMFGSLPERYLDYLYNNDRNAFDGFVDSFWSALSPDMVPSFFLLPFEMSSNWSNYYQRKIVPESELQYAKRDQFGPYTSDTARWLADAVYNGSSPIMNFFGKDGLEFSPRNLEYAVNSLFGNLGREGLKGMDAAVRAVEGKELPTRSMFEDMPVTNRFVSNPSKMRRTENTFREDLDKALTDVSSAALHAKSMSRASLPPEERRLLGAKDSIQRLQTKELRAITALQKEIKEITSDKRMDGDRKRQLIDIRDKKIKRISEEGLRKLNRILGR